MSDGRSSNLYLDYLENIKDLFCFFKIDSSGRMSVAQLRNIIKRISRHIPGINLEPLIHEIEMNFDGFMRVEDLANLMCREFSEQDDERDLINAFIILDRDKDGFLSKKELATALSQLGDGFTEKEIQEIINQVDSDSGGKINFMEFARLMTM